jgi:hypothetical protein
MRKHILFAAASLILVACSAAPDGSSTDPTAMDKPQHYDPPAGCAKTACDVDAQHCRVNANSACSKCEIECSDIDYTVRAQCDATCAQLCANTKKTVDGCETTLDTCVASSPRNAFCADGIKDACVPGGASGAKLPDGLTAHAGVCGDADIDALLKECFTKAGTSATCQSFVSKHQACWKCTVGATGAQPLWLAQENGNALWTNDGLCVALRGDVDCGGAVFEAEACAERACLACDDQSNIAACVNGAYDVSCRNQKAKMDSCVAKLSPETRAMCVTDPTGDFVAVAKPMIALACGS